MDNPWTFIALMLEFELIDPGLSIYMINLSKTCAVSVKEKNFTPIGISGITDASHISHTIIGK